MGTDVDLDVDLDVDVDVDLGPVPYTTVLSCTGSVTAQEIVRPEVSHSDALKGLKLEEFGQNFGMTVKRIWPDLDLAYLAKSKSTSA